VISIYGDMRLCIPHSEDGYATSVIFTTLFLLKYVWMYILCTAVEELGIIPSVVISHLYIRNETYVALFINLL
jgi:hypothetical protein